MKKSPSPAYEVIQHLAQKFPLYSPFTQWPKRLGVSEPAATTHNLLLDLSFCTCQVLVSCFSCLGQACICWCWGVWFCLNICMAISVPIPIHCHMTFLYILLGVHMAYRCSSISIYICIYIYLSTSISLQLYLYSYIYLHSVVIGSCID